MEPHSGLNNLDYIVIGIILLSGLLALMRGFVCELFSLVAWVGAYFVALRFYPQVTPRMHHYIKADKPAEWAAMAAVYIAALILLIIIGMLIERLVIRGQALTAIDRSLGFLYGLLRGALVVSFVYLGAVMIFWPEIDKPLAEKAADKSEQQVDQAAADKDANTPPDWLMQARTRPLLSLGARKLQAVIPKDLIDKTLQDYPSPKKDKEQHDEDQRALDLLSTPTPQARPIGDSIAEHLDINKMMNQGTKP